MVFRLHPDDTAELASFRHRPLALDGLETLLVSHAEGVHFVALSHAQGRAAADLPLSPRARRGLAAARDLATYRVPGARPMTVRLGPPVSADWTARVVNIEAFAATADAACTRLVAEGEDDLYFYEALAKESLDPDLRKVASVALEPVLAGGGNFPHLWGRQAATGARPMVGIVDSDAKDPKAKTATNTTAADRKVEPGNRELRVLRAREVENLLPLALLEAAFANEGDVLGRIAAAGTKVGSGGTDDLKALVAHGMAHRSVQWLKQQGASPEARRRALDAPCAEAAEVAALVASWGLAAVRCRF